MKFDLKQYFNRIGWHPNGESLYEQLSAVHMRHAQSIPFENLDAYLNHSVSLDPDDIFDKIVMRKRGGYCFEMNALIYLALDAMGFEIKPYAARVCREKTGYSGYSHRVNIVELNAKRYLIDVGFGGNGLITPVLLEEGLIQRQQLNTYRVVRSAHIDFALQCLKEGEFSDMIGFNDRPALQEDFVIGNYYTGSNPGSFFAANIICIIPTEKGRISLVNNTLTIVENGGLRKIEVPDEKRSEVLKTYFHIEDENVLQQLKEKVTVHG